MRNRLAVLEHELDVRDSRIARLEATIAAYDRGARGEGPSVGLR
jgi:hypothetical protein